MVEGVGGKGGRVNEHLSSRTRKRTRGEARRYEGLLPPSHARFGVWSWKITQICYPRNILAKLSGFCRQKWKHSKEFSKFIIPETWNHFCRRILIEIRLSIKETKQTCLEEMEGGLFV